MTESLDQTVVGYGPRRGGARRRRIRWSVDSSGQDLRRGVRVVLATSSILVLSAALPALLLAQVPDVGRSTAWTITFLVILWGGIRLSLLWVNGRPRLFDFFFWLFCYIFMGVGPTVQMRADAVSTTTPGIDPAYDLPTAGILALGLVCYELARAAYILRERAVAGRKSTQPPRSTRGVDGARTAILLVVGLALSAYYLYRVGPGGALGSREAAVNARATAWPDPALRVIFSAGAAYPLLVGAGALAQLRRIGSSKQLRTLATIGLLGCIVVLLLVVNPISSARYNFGTALFALAVFLGAVATRLRARLTMLATILGFLFVFPIADAFRRTEVNTSRAGFFDEYLSNPDYDAFWQIANALSFWIDGLVVPFRQFLGSVLFWVPRAVWADKPTDTGITLAEYRGYTFDNLSAPLWAEALVNGGIIGVVVTFLLLGVALRAMDGKILPAFATGGVWAIVGAILPVYLTILMRGSLLQATGALAITIICVLFVRGRPQAPPPVIAPAAPVAADAVTAGGDTPN